MKILLCGEGAHDIGVLDQWSIHPDKQMEKPGWLQVLLRKIFEKEDVEFILVPRSRLVSLPRSDLKPPAPKGHGEKARISKFRALTDKCDLVVFMLDADTTDISEWKRKRDEVIAGFEAIAGDVKAVACIPMSASESWILSDSEAWKKVGLTNLSALPKKPEEIWGVRNDPDSGHPHCYFKRICSAANLSDNRETRVDVMTATSLEEVGKKCPASFKAFLADLAA